MLLCTEHLTESIIYLQYNRYVGVYIHVQSCMHLHTKTQSNTSCTHDKLYMGCIKSHTGS